MNSTQNTGYKPNRGQDHEDGELSSIGYEFEFEDDETNVNQQQPVGFQSSNQNFNSPFPSQEQLQGIENSVYQGKQPLGQNSGITNSIVKDYHVQNTHTTPPKKMNQSMDEPDVAQNTTPAHNHIQNEEDEYDSGPGTHGDQRDIDVVSIPTHILNNQSDYGRSQNNNFQQPLPTYGQMDQGRKRYRDSIETYADSNYPDQEEYKRESDRPPNQMRNNDNGRGNQQVERDHNILASTTNEDGVVVNQVRTNSIASMMKSKMEIYSILVNQGQYYLPPYAECNIEFLRDIFAGRKKVFLSEDVRMINVPKLREFSAVNLINDAYGDKVIRQYLPDYKSDGRALNRQYLFNIMNTVKPNFFKENIKDSLEKRRDEAAQRQKKFIEITSDIYNLVKNSVNLNPKQRGRALNLLSVGTKKRKQPESQGQIYHINQRIDKYHYSEAVVPAKSPAAKRFKGNEYERASEKKVFLRSKQFNSTGSSNTYGSSAQPQYVAPVNQFQDKQQ